MQPTPSIRTSTQRGAALLVFALLLFIGLFGSLLTALNSTATQPSSRDQITSDALAQAKAALIGYAVSVSDTADRPGDLPCPDRDNDGLAGTTMPLDSSCGNAAGGNQAKRLGRLPWKNLGLSDLRDASGERLWYAVSNNFKNLYRTAKLNSDTNGTITIRDSRGNIVFDGGAGTGVVAVIIAPGEPITRQDGLVQNRSSANVNDPRHFLDNIAAEDNADFDEITTPTNGFFAGPAYDANNAVIANDRILVITQAEIMSAIEKRVANEVRHALLVNYCGPGNFDENGTCIASGGSRFFPRPAEFSDASCLGTSDIVSLCNSGVSNNAGRIPANPATPWNPPTSLLRGTTNGVTPHNWFQMNGWREQIYYAVANACIDGTTNCSGVGTLTVNRPPGTPSTNQKVVVIVAGKSLSTTTPAQTRAASADKLNAANYLEDENLLPLDNTFTRSQTILSAPFNDRVLSLQ